MQNYKDIHLVYDSEAILKVLDTLPKLVIPCSAKTVVQIYNILKINVPIQSILYFKLQPSEVGIIHIDKNLSKKTNNAEFAFNLPLLNSDNVLMKWYIDNDPSINCEIFTGPNGTNTPLLPKNRAHCIDQLYYTSPHIVKINDWHSVENKSTTDIAHFISLRFFSPLDIVMKELSPYSRIDATRE